MFRILRRSFSSSSLRTMAPKPGDRLPDVPVYLENGQKVKVTELTAGKRAVIFSLPGAFTPLCHKEHLPGYVEDYDKIKGYGIDIIACLSVNDHFVMDAWAESLNAKGKIAMLCDPNADFTRAMGEDMLLTSKPELGVRGGRFAMLIKDGAITSISIEDPGKFECSRSSDIIKLLEAEKK